MFLVSSRPKQHQKALASLRRHAFDCLSWNPKISGIEYSFLTKSSVPPHFSTTQHAVGITTPPNSSTILPRPLRAQSALGRMRSGESAREDCDADPPLPPPSFLSPYLLPSSPSHHPSSRPRHGFLTWKLILHNNSEMKMPSSCKRILLHYFKAWKALP